jgi:hypothetical protein
MNRRHEEQTEHRSDGAGAAADDRSEAEAEQSEHREEETAAGHRPEHTGIADGGPQAVVGEEGLEHEVEARR